MRANYDTSINSVTSSVLLGVHPWETDQSVILFYNHFIFNFLLFFFNLQFSIYLNFLIQYRALIEMLFFAVLGILLFSAGMPAPTFIHMGHGFAEPERSQKEVCLEKRVSLSVEMATIKSETWNRQCMGSWKHKKELLNHQEATLLASIAMLSSLNETKVINLHEAIIEVIKKSPKSASHMRHIR